MSELILPKIVNAGIYDASTAHKNKTETRKRRVSLFELEIPMENGGVSHINDTEYPILADHVICGKPGQLRYTMLPFRCYFVHLLVEKGSLYEYLSILPDHFQVPEREKYCQLFSDIITAFSFPSEGSEIYLAGKVLHLIYSLCKDRNGRNGSNYSWNSLISEAISYMDEHYPENPRLSDIAAALNISPIYFHRMFCAATGQSPYQYLLDKKLAYARKMLLTTPLPLSDIALRAGFSSQSHFGSVFKKETGKTPLQYRKEMYRTYPE